MSDDLLTLGLGARCAAAQVVSEEPSVAWFKPGPGVLVNLSGQPFDPVRLNAGHRLSHERRLECLRSVHLLWSNFFVADGLISTIYDANTRASVEQVVAIAELSRYVGLTQRCDDFTVPRAPAGCAARSRPRAVRDLGRAA